MVAFVDCSLFLQNGASLVVGRLGDREPQELVAVEPRIEVEGLDGNAISGFLERFLKAAKVLLNAVDQRPLHVEDESCKHRLASDLISPFSKLEPPRGSISRRNAAVSRPFPPHRRKKGENRMPNRAQEIFKPQFRFGLGG